MPEQPKPMSIYKAIQELKFLADRTPTTPDEDMTGAFAELSIYRDGAIYVGHWAGASEWERHPIADEIVLVIDGKTTIFLLVDGTEQSHELAPGELVVVPQGTWHRFETPDEVKLLSVTPQPSDHRTSRPD